MVRRYSHASQQPQATAGVGQRPMTPMDFRWFVVLALAALISSPGFPGEDLCEFRTESVNEPGSQLHWAYQVGTELKGSTEVDLAGDGQPEHLDIFAEIQRDYSINVATGEQSKEKLCWFRTSLRIRTKRGRLIYRDEWSIQFEDMAVLLETHGASSPQEYFARFGRHNGFFSSGIETVQTREAEIRQDAIGWSLQLQGIKGSDAVAIVRELSRLSSLRVFIYRAEWREDLRVISMVPSLKRAVAIQIGY